MAAVQLSFNMRTSAGVKTVHLLGSWDNYSGQLPLAKDKSGPKAGSWKGTFRFQGSTLEPGQRYWYYYIVDGYHVSHDAAEASTVEPTTGRKLNILDVPHSSSSSSSPSSSRSKTSSSSKSSSSKHHSSRDKHSSSSRDKHSSSSNRRESRRDSLNLSLDIPKGRPLSVSKIQSPKPVSPGAARFLNGGYEPQTVEELTERFANTAFTDVDYDLSSSPPSSVGSSLSSRSGSSSGLSSASSMSDYSSSGSPVNCTCERYGITRKGDRIKLDCGGSRCGYLDDNGSCCSDDSQEEYISTRHSRRGGVHVRR